jgi:hypothetical protein
MATLYVENVPEEVYEALRERAKRNHRSIAAEVNSILQREVPTAAELQRRRDLMREILEIRARSTMDPGPSTEEMVREDRER